jgi:hypothetical protein
MISNNLYVIAAICGNFWQESQINPGAWENWTVGQPGYGLGQWTDNPPVVMRRTALFDWLDANNYAHDSGPGQLAFLVHENLWIPTLFQQSAYNTLSDYFASTSTSLSDLVLEWMYHWEGIDDGSYNTRLTAATQILSDFQNDDGARQPWTAVNSQISFRAARDNAMHIKDFFLEEDPPEPPTPPGPEPPTEDELIALLKLARKKKLKGGIFITW